MVTKKEEDLKTDKLTKEDRPKWMAQLPDRLKFNERLAKLGSIGELADEYLKMVEKDGK